MSVRLRQARRLGILLGACAVLASGSSGCGVARADEVLVQELEGLRNSLPSNDPGRQAMTLRLADTIFDDVGEITRHPDLSDAQRASAASLRKRALKLYGETLTGGGGMYPAVSGRQRHKVMFQMARINADLGLSQDADVLWKALLAQGDLPDLKREAALRLAESAEAMQDHAGAEKLYTQAIALCAGGDTCSYGHYRRAWAMKNQDRVAESVAEIQLALYDSKGQLREEALRDFIVFLASEGGADGKRALDLIDPISAKLSRPELLESLADAFYSAGNRPAGTHVLAFANARSPQIKAQVRLIEEFYGLRQVEPFREALQKATAMAPSNRMDPAAQPETEKVLRRMTVQLDGERVSRPEFAADFRRAVELYLALFPAGKERLKMMEGWLASEPDASRRSERIKTWIGDPSLALASGDLLKLRELRASAAQIAKDSKTVADEAAALMVLSVADPAKSREFKYVNARALYELKDYDRCLPIFRELAKVDAESVGKAGKLPAHALESQHLALDILGQRKDYRGVIEQAALWSSGPAKAGSTPTELAEIGAISEKAEFELAASLGQTPEALAIFHKFCAARKLQPQSCDNAKIVAVRTRNQSALLSVLKTLDSREELAAEYEASGYFAEAAELHSQRIARVAAASNQDYLRAATLYELGGKVADRDRVLVSLMARIKKEKSMGAEEGAIDLMLDEAGLIDAKLLSLPWSAVYRSRIADRLESRGKGSAETRKILAASLESTGPAWDSMVIEQSRALDAAQRKIGFYGNHGQRKFENRLAALKKAVAHAEKLLPGAGARTRAEIAGILAKSHNDLAAEILASPVPPQLDQAQAEQVKQAIAQLSEPFRAKAVAYEAMVAEQSAKLVPAPDAQPKPEARPDPAAQSRAIGMLHESPTARQALLDLKAYYAASSQKRLAAYFQGRITQLDQEGGSQ